MKKEELTNAPKVFCERINIGFTPEYFVLAVASGNQGTIYTLTPQHAKRLQQYLAHQVKEFEEKHGTINAEWNPNIPSPIQRTDGEAKP